MDTSWTKTLNTSGRESVILYVAWTAESETGSAANSHVTINYKE